MRTCYCDYCNCRDRKECKYRECDCCGEYVEYEHYIDLEENVE